MAAVAAAMAMPAFAEKGDNPTTGSCGVGRLVAHSAIETPREPGASEAGRGSTEFCRGQ
jgi:hypothetical protein